MLNTIRLEMTPPEWAALIRLAAKAKPTPKDEEEVEMAKTLTTHRDTLTQAKLVAIKDPF